MPNPLKTFHPIESNNMKTVLDSVPQLKFPLRERNIAKVTLTVCVSGLVYAVLVTCEKFRGSVCVGGGGGG
jgi:hypothetical protein